MGHLDWRTRLRFTTAMVVSIGLIATVGYSAARQWDPQAPISLLLAQHPLGLWLRLAALTAVLVCLVTVIMDARVKDCGAFVASICLAYLPIKTGGMDYLLIYLQAGKSADQAAAVWLSLAAEALAWLVLIGGAVIIGRAVELWLTKGSDNQGAPDQPVKLLDQLIGKNWLKGVSAMLITMAVAGLLIPLLAASQHKGQIVFALACSFFIAALLAEHLVGSDGAFWQVLAVPLLAVVGYLYTYYYPDRPIGYENLLNIPPNQLVRALPIEFATVGTASVIWGTWFSHRLRFDRKK